MDYAYPSEALVQDADRRRWRLRPFVGAGTLPWRVRIAPGGMALSDSTGRLLAKGAIETGAPLHLAQRGGNILRLDPVRIGGGPQLYLASEPLVQGMCYAEADSPVGRLPATPEQIAVVPCLGTGTMVATDQGPQPVDWLRPGDRLLTRDNGYQTLSWLGQVTMPRHSAAATRPLTVAAGALGADLPAAPVTLTPGQRILLAGPQLALRFGEPEMLARAGALIARRTNDAGRQPLYHLLLRDPEVILAEGLWLDSAQATPDYLNLLPEPTRLWMIAHLGDRHRHAARPWLHDGAVAMMHRETAARRASAAA